MQLNSLVFPAPAASYAPKYHTDLLWIPKPKQPVFPNLRITSHLQLPSLKPKSQNSCSQSHVTPPLKEYFSKIETPTNIFSSNESPSLFCNSQANNPMNNSGRKLLRDFGSHNLLFSLKNSGFSSPRNCGKSLSFIKANTPSLKKKSVNENEGIPCLFLEAAEASSFVLVHFHANAEDIGDTAHYMKIVSSLLKVNCLIVEYPGYGVYKGKCSSEAILKDAETVMEYLINELSIPARKILIMGRSVGTGPATFLATKYAVAAIILVSAYMSLKKLVGDHYGKLAKWLIAERFENAERISKVQCPVLLIHGLKDELISYNHAVELQKNVRKDVFSEVFLAKNMTHNRMDLINDVVKPIMKFLIKTDIWKEMLRPSDEKKVIIPDSLRAAPGNLRGRKGKSFVYLFMKNKKPGNELKKL